jgi:CRISPR-associated exonuclease Cas4
VTISLILLILAVALLWLALRLRRRTGLPWARIAASDSGSGYPVQSPLVARRYGLTGKPDYLLERRGHYIPVEVKPGRQANQPYDSDLMQLAAYCLLVEAAMGQPPPYGILRYAEVSFRLDYTPAVREELLTILDDMREELQEPDCERSHDEPRRCAGCGFLEMCDDALVEP